MTVTAYVVDTPYLCELFKVDGKSSKAASVQVKQRFVQAAESNCRFFVPLPCIFELGNHIAQISKGTKRRKLAKQVCRTVESSLKEQNPWSIKPSKDINEVMSRLGKAYSGQYVEQGIGLTDSYVISEAQTLKNQYTSLYTVHIWTMDSALKAFEPDTEPNPFVGS